MAKKYGPAYGPKAKKAIKAMIASGAVVKITGRRGRKPKSSAVTTAVKAYVEKAIDREIQDKEEVNQIFSTLGGATSGMIRGYGIDSASTNYGITTANSIVPIIVSGLEEDKRVGNYIRPKSLTVRYAIKAFPIDPTIFAINKQSGVPFYVCVLFYNRRDTKTNQTNSTLKDNGSGSTTFTTIFDHLLPWNKEMYNIIAYRKYKMHATQQIALVGTTEVQTTEPAINGCTSLVLDSVKIKLPKKLMYDDATQQPTNTRIYCAVGVFNFDGSTTDRATTIRAGVDMTSHMVYQNA